jgi:hypothetical protein
MMNVGSINHTFPSIGYAINAAKNGRMSLPVAPAQLIYSHFKHVSGTPAPEGTQGVNISKLKIINTLIEQLSRMKNETPANLGEMSASDEKRIDAMIEQYQKQLKAAQSVAHYAPAAPNAGVLFNITV